jgi:arginase family enzyme
MVPFDGRGAGTLAWRANDVRHAPEVGWPVPAGLTLRHLLELLHYVRQRYQVVGVDLVEAVGESGGTNLAALALARCALVFFLTRTAD